MRHIGPEAAAFVRAVFSLNDPGELENLVSGAGFRGVDVRPHTRTLPLPEPKDFLWQYVHSTPLAARIAQADDERRAALERDVLAKWQEFVKDGVLIFRLEGLVATARKSVTSGTEALRALLRSDLEAAREEFRAMAASISDQAWTETSHNRGWTNGQVLFHVLLGFILVPPLASILVLFGHLPALCSKVFARILDFSTPLFNRINAAGPRAGARLLGRGGITRQFDRVHGAILRRLDRVRSRDWALAMYYPTRWDPRFQTLMRLEDLFRYPVAHLRHHRTQLRAT